MKKRLVAALLVALLASSMVFAAFTGSAKVGLGADFDTKAYGFANDTNVKFNIDLATASADKKAEGDVYASIKATLALFILNDQKDGTTAAGNSAPIDYTAGNSTDANFNLKVKIDEAKINGSNWYVGILGIPGNPDFAKSEIDTWDNKTKTKFGVNQPDETEKASYAVPYNDKVPGVEIGFEDFVFGFGLDGKATKSDYTDTLNVTGYAKTPEFDFEGVKLQAAAVYSMKKAATVVTDNAVGASLKAGFEMDAIKATVATDFGYDVKNEKFGVDVAGNFVYDFLTADVYYAKDVTVDTTAVKNLLSAKVVTDLNSFDVPVKLTVTGKDLVNKQDLSAKAEFTIENITLTPSVGFVVKSKDLSVGLDAKYKAESFTAKAGVSAKLPETKADNTVLKASASIESDSVVPGATVALAWADAKDLLKKNAAETKKYGKVTASIKIAF